MYPTPVPAMVVPQNPHSAPVGRIRPPAAVAVPNRIEISDVDGLRGELDKLRPYDDSELRGKVEALEAKSEKDPQFGAWKTDVLPGLLAGKADAALVDVRGLQTDKRVAVGEGADASGASVAVGFDAKATGPVATAVGEETRATADSSAAFGSKAESTALGAVQLGNGVNETERSLQFRGANLFVVASRDTKVAQLGTGFPYTASVVDSGAVLPTSKAVKDFVEGKGYLTSFKETDPEFAKWRSSTCLSAGFGAKVGTQANTAVGNAAEATGNSSSAFGTQAKATAVAAVQLGLGTNTTDRTLQFRGANLFRVESSKTSVATLGAGFPKASKSVFGAVKVGDNLSVEDGVVSAVVPTKTSQLDNDSNFVSDVLGRTCVHSFGTEAVPPIDGVRVSAYEWRFNYDMPGVTAHYILFSGGTWEIGAFNPSGEHMPMYEVEAPFDVDSLDFGDFGSVAFSGADDMVARESRLPKRTSQLKNDSGFLTSVPTGDDIRASADDEKTVADSLAAKADEFTEWECTPALPSGWFIRRTEGGIGQDPGYQLWNNEGFVEDFYASFRDDKLEFQFSYALYTAKRKRVLRTGDAPTSEQLSEVSSKVDEIKETMSTDNRLLVGGSYDAPPDAGSPTTAAIQTRESEDAEWVDEIRVDKGYDALTGSTMVKLDKSVQTVTVAGSNLVIEIPDSVNGTVRDLCVYANNSSDADTALTFPAGTYYGDNPNGAVAKAKKVTAIYLTEIPKGVWRLRIEELEQHEVPA